ncbi:MAG: SUF system Fe-S cluster assembly protein [Magnetovibrio sp.]|nr:SUF system Fe-S cluster assembly protein [Magnetovibrio sp.]
MTEFSAKSGECLEPGSKIAKDSEVIEAMRTVYDPEIPVNIYDLGLIYTIDIQADGNVYVEMSLTAPGCPVAGEMPGMVCDAVADLDGVGVVETKIVWEPAWTPELMTEDAKLALGMF